MTDEEQTVTITLAQLEAIVDRRSAVAVQTVERIKSEQIYTRPDEPTNLGAVVVDEGDEGNTFVRVFLSGQRTWMSAGSGATFRWSELAKPRVKSHGWDGSGE